MLRIVLIAALPHVPTCESSRSLSLLLALLQSDVLPDVFQVAQRAFGFCERFQRKNEFGRLVDQLRRHFNQSIKYVTTPHALVYPTSSTISICTFVLLCEYDVAHVAIADEASLNLIQ